MESNNRTVKGCVILGYMDFIRDIWGRDGLDKLLVDLEMGLEIREGEEYYVEWLSHILSWIADNKGEEYIEDAGRYAIANLGGLSHIVDHLDIRTILKDGTQKYATAYNEGNFLVKLHDSSANVIIKGSGSNDKHACKAWVGVFKGMLDVTRTIGTVKEILCERDGAEHCEFLIEWKTFDPMKSSRLR